MHDLKVMAEQKSEQRRDNYKKALYLESQRRSRHDQRMREKLHSSMEVQHTNFENLSNKIKRKQYDYSRKRDDIIN